MKITERATVAWREAGITRRINAISSGVNNGYCAQSSIPYGISVPRRMSTNPAACSLFAKTRSARAPEIQPAQAAGLVRISGGRSSSTTMSAATKRPPGRSTR